MKGAGRTGRLVLVGQEAAAGRATDTDALAAVHAALGVISSVCDYAETLDSKGFSAADAFLGHVLARMPAELWTDSAALTGWDMLRKYRRQLTNAGIDFDQLPRPAGADELEADREQAREDARQQAREDARLWREQQYRQTHTYVRCDGEGEQVTLAFPYDPDLVAACRKIAGRRYDGASKANLFPFTSLPAVVELAARHGIEVTPDVRALAAIAADQAAERAAQPQIRLDDRDAAIIIDAPYDLALTKALKEANGDRATFDYGAKVHRLPIRCAMGIPGLAQEFGLRISDQAREAIALQVSHAERNRAAASIFEADPVPVPGLAEGQALKAQQFPVVRFALEHRRVLIGDEMGWGKTLSSLAAVAVDGAYPAVVICRPSLTLNWVAEIRRFFPRLTVYEASGTTPQPVPPGTHVIVIGSAALAAKPLKKDNGGKEFGWVEELKKTGPKALIIDEGQDTKERSANRSQACEQLAEAVIARDGLVLDLTGTAILNRPRELCQQLTILGRIGEFGGPKAFMWRYCLSETNEWGASYNGARNLIELHDRLTSWGIMIRRADDAALGLPPCREHVLSVPKAELDPAVMERYQQAEADLLKFLADQARQAAQRLGKDPDSAAVEAVMRASAAEHLVAINALRQLAGRAKRGYVTAWVREHVAAGEKVMVAAHHRDEVDAYAAAFGGLKLQGGQPVAEKEAVKARFQQRSAAEAPVIAVAIGAGGVGHTLTAARIGIQAEQAWTPGETQQMKKRLHRIGQDRPVDYYITVAEGTIDEQLWSVVTAKQATLDAVLDGRSGDGAADDERSVAAELTWRLTQQGLASAADERQDGAPAQDAAPAGEPGASIVSRAPAEAKGSTAVSAPEAGSAQAKPTGRSAPSADLVDYHGSVVDKHGLYLKGDECACNECEAMRARYAADPNGGYYLPDVRWVLCDPETGAVVLAHVRPESFTRVPAGGKVEQASESDDGEHADVAVGEPAPDRPSTAVLRLADGETRAAQISYDTSGGGSYACPWCETPVFSPEAWQEHERINATASARLGEPYQPQPYPSVYAAAWREGGCANPACLVNLRGDALARTRHQHEQAAARQREREQQAERIRRYDEQRDELHRQDEALWARTEAAAGIADPGEPRAARRGDLIVIREHHPAYSTSTGPYDSYIVGVVTSVTRDGAVKTFRRAGDFPEPEGGHGKPDKGTDLARHRPERAWVMRAAFIDVPGTLATAACHIWPGHEENARPYESMEDVCAAMRPHLKTGEGGGWGRLYDAAGQWEDARRQALGMLAPTAQPEQFAPAYEAYQAAVAAANESYRRALAETEPSAATASQEDQDDDGLPAPASAAAQGQPTQYERECGNLRLTVHAPRPGELDRDAFTAFAAAQTVLGLDVETTAVEDGGPRQFDPSFTVRLIQFGSDHEAWVLNLADPEQLDAAAAVLANPEARFVTHTPYDVLAVWSALGIPLGQRVADTHLLSKLINPDERAEHGLKELSARHLDDGLIRAEEALHERMQAAAPTGHRAGNAWLRWGWNHLPADDEAYVVYAGLDAIYARRLLPVLARECAPFAHLARAECWLAAQATGISIRGLLLDQPYAKAVLAELEAEHRAADAAIRAALGCPGASPKFAAWLDEQAAQAGIAGPPRTPTGQLQITGETLTSLLDQHAPSFSAETADLIRKRLALSKTSNLIANLRGLLAAADAEGRVHPQINTLRAKTARMSITAPALQTLKKHDPRLRRCLRADPGHVLISCDFSQVEVRVAAALSRDPALTAAIKSGIDIHDTTAVLIYGPGFTAEQRSIAKRATFGAIYGGGARALAAQTGATEEAAREVISRWKAAYPRVADYTGQLAGQDEVITPSGRHIPADQSRPYASGNYAIQSTARDLLLVAVYTLVTAGNVGGLWLFVHDEIIVQAHEHDAERVRDVLQQAMTTTFRGLPIVAEAEILGTAWGHLDSATASASTSAHDDERGTESASAEPESAQVTLFGTAGLENREPVSGVPAGRFDPAVCDAALQGDRYQWLNHLLPDPPAPACETCHQAMRLDPDAAVFWTCPSCYPADAGLGTCAAIATRTVQVQANKEDGSAVASTSSDQQHLQSAAHERGADTSAVRPKADDEDEVAAHVPMRGEELREAAHRYLEHGLLPVPAWAARQNGECCCPRGADCPRPGKHPRSVHVGPGPYDYSWKPLACRTHAEVDQRFAAVGEYAAGNLMVAIPPGMMAIDRDDDEGGRAALASLTEELGELPPTLSHKTPHGEHLIYRTPAGWTGRAWVGKDASNPLPAGIDLRMPGQVLMAAPSAVPGRDGPLRYGPPTGDHAAALPTAYVRAWTPPQSQAQPVARRVPVPPDSADRVAKYVNDAMKRIADDLASRKPGGRNAAVYAAGLKVGSLLGAAGATPGAERAAAAWTDSAVEQALMDAASRNGYVGKDGPDEARRAIRSGLRNGMRNPRALPDFTTPPAGPARRPATGPRPAPSGADRPQPGQPAATPARQSRHWQSLVPPDLRRDVEAADREASTRRGAAIAAHQDALERHDRSPSQQTAAEVERTRAEAHVAHQAYTYDGRHIVGRHDAAMLRWAAAISARRSGVEPAPGQPDTARMQANRIALLVNEAYQSGDLDRARQLVDHAAQLDPSRADLWQTHRNEIAARGLVLAARTANAEGDHKRADKLFQEARQLDPRLRTLWDGSMPAARTGRSSGRRPETPESRAGAGATQPSAQADQHREPADRQSARKSAGPVPERRQRTAPGPTSSAPGGTQPAAPQPATSSVPREPRSGRQPAAHDPGPSAGTSSAALSRWPARSPRSSRPDPSPAQQAGHEAASGQLPRGASASISAAEAGSMGAGRPSGSAADWRDQVLQSARHPWQPRLIQPYNPAVLRGPDAVGRGVEI